jgi:hypothetical protein
MFGMSIDRHRPHVSPQDAIRDTEKSTDLKIESVTGKTIFALKIPKKQRLEPLVTKPLKEGEDLHPAEAIESFERFSSDIIRNEQFIKELSRKESLRRGLFPISEGLWEMDMNCPEPVLLMIGSALKHEALINPNINESICDVDIRGQLSSDSYGWRYQDTKAPHFDYADALSVSLYFLASPPATVQYTGTYPEPRLSGSAYPFGRNVDPQQWLTE